MNGLGLGLVKVPLVEVLALLDDIALWLWNREGFYGKIIFFIPCYTI